MPLMGEVIVPMIPPSTPYSVRVAGTIRPRTSQATVSRIGPMIAPSANRRPILVVNGIAGCLLMSISCYPFLFQHHRNFLCQLLRNDLPASYACAPFRWPFLAYEEGYTPGRVNTVAKRLPKGYFPEARGAASRG